MAEQQRKLYKMDHLTQRLGLTPRTIRYYDQFGLLPHVKRSEGGIRLFDDNDIAIIQKIRKMQNKEGLSLAKIKQKLVGQRGGTTDKKCAIVTDSFATLPKLSGLNVEIHVLPITLHVGKRSFKDDPNVSSTEIWPLNNQKKEVPTLTLPTEQAFEVLFKSLAKKGYTDIYALHVSSSLSSLVNTAKSAAKKLESSADIHIIDTQTIGNGQGLLVQALAKAIDRKESKKELALLLKKQVPLAMDMILVRTLDYLLSGGILKKSTSGQRQFLDQFLQFKPIVQFKDASGILDMTHCCKTTEEGVGMLFEKSVEEINCRGGYVGHILISYHRVSSDAKRLCNRFKIEYPKASVDMAESGHAFSTLMGPGCLGISII